MKIKNVEIKATCRDSQHLRNILVSLGAHYAGCDHQIDTYYETAHGRLKLRQGNIENALIAYRRKNTSAPKLSDVHLYKTSDPDGLAEILNSILDPIVVIDKNRDIYFIDNVKFHLDEVSGLGNFMEIEAMDAANQYEESELRRQVVMYMDLLGIQPDDLLTHSYSDMIRMAHEA